MPIRMLLVLLFALGSSPFRVCTCVSASPFTVSDTQEIESHTVPADFKKGCRCHSESKSRTKLIVKQTSAEQSPTSLTNDSAPHAPHQHHPSCPMAAVTTVVEVQATVVELPQIAEQLTSDESSSIESRCDLKSRPCPPTIVNVVPRYISLCTLRN